ncbi:MAG: hypothetical protein ACE15E_22245 [Acidobacteriota bacterium]
MVYVRWSDFPPASSLTLSNLRLAVEFFDGTGGRSSTAPGLKAGDPMTFNELKFEKPPSFKISSCESPLAGVDRYRKMRPGWYFPTDDGTVADVFILANEAGGYRYHPENSLSPFPHWTRHVSKELGKGDRICGPLLTFLTGAQTFKSDHWIEEASLSSLDLGDDLYLLKWGPRVGSLSSFGTGADGASPTIRVDVFHLNRRTGIAPALSARLLVDLGRVVDGDIQFSPDWKTVTIYQAQESPGAGREAWTSQQYCLSGMKYKECKETSPSEAPPEPRQVQVKLRE